MISIILLLFVCCGMKGQLLSYEQIQFKDDGLYGYNDDDNDEFR